MLLDLRKGDIKLVSLKTGDQFLHSGTGGEPVHIYIGMKPEKISVRRDIYGICVTVIEDICHDFFQYTDLITFGIQIQEFALFRADHSGKSFPVYGDQSI